MSQIEEQIRLAIDMEKIQEVIQTKSFGDILKKDSGDINKGKENTSNAELIDNFVQHLVYNNRYPMSQDIKLGGKAIIAMKALYNDKLAKPFGWTPVEEKASALSLVKLADAVNRGFRSIKLGGSVATGAINAFGLNMQMLAQNSKYYPPTDFLTEQAKLSRLTQSSEKEGNLFFAAPMVEEPLPGYLESTYSSIFLSLPLSTIIFFRMAPKLAY